ncbi:MAG: hypothetical protein WD648_10115 [Planctomycetaceae bacterium]
MTQFELASFTVDVTPEIGQRLMAVSATKAKEIVDPLFAHGFVLTGADEPIVVLAIDWCEIRNGAYDHWRDVLAEAAGTKRERVLLSSLHQHDAPVTDIGAENLLARVGLAGEMFDLKFHEQCVRRAASALVDCLKTKRRVTHVGVGQAPVENVASNRRVVGPDGSVSFHRGSSSGGDPKLAAAPIGMIDPNLKTLTFFDGETPLLSLHAYATHPMSYYGRGGVSADFVGMARDLRQRDEPAVKQMYVSGCSGDVTAGKFNDGSPANRPLLAHRLHQAMQKAWQSTERHPLEKIGFRSTELDLEYRKSPTHTREALDKVLTDPQAQVRDRILAAMGLSSRQRVASGRLIDFPVIDFGPAQIVLFPAEVFVGYQLIAQQMRPESFVVSIGYGECWPGYIPTNEAFDDGFTDVWLWVAPGAEAKIRAALQKVLLPS